MGGAHRRAGSCGVFGRHARSRRRFGRTIYNTCLREASASKFGWWSETSTKAPSRDIWVLQPLIDARLAQSFVPGQALSEGRSMAVGLARPPCQLVSAENRGRPADAVSWWARAGVAWFRRRPPGPGRRLATADHVAQAPRLCRPVQPARDDEQQRPGPSMSVSVAVARH